MSSSIESSTAYPLVSIGVPTYNGANRIQTALNSIWNSNYPNLEIIICDNCSTDGTEELCQQVVREHPGVRYIRHQENIGILRNFEFALKAATGDYFMWLSDDDSLESNVLSKYVEFLESNPDFVMATGKIRYLVENATSHLEGVSFEHRNPSKRIVQYYTWVRWGGMFHGLMRREAAQKVPKRNVYGYDWHYVANIVYLGKAKVFDFVGYNKELGGTSGDWVRMAKTLKEPSWVGRMPKVKMAIDAYRELYSSPTFDGMSIPPKFFVAVSCGLAILYKLLPQALRHNIKKEEYYRSIRPKAEIIKLREQVEHQ